MHTNIDSIRSAQTSLKSSAFTKRKFGLVMTYTFLIANFIFCLYPLIWMLINSVKATPEILEHPWGLPRHFTWAGYIGAFGKGKIALLLSNSVFITVIAGFLCITLSFFAAYGIQRMKWKWSNVVYMIFLLGIMIPVHSIVLPLYISFVKIGLNQSRWGLILPYVATNMAYSILILTGFLKSLSSEFEQSAAIDGCSLPRIVLQIILPIMKPVIATVLIFNFIAMWNELFLALIILAKPHLYTLPIGALRFRDLYSQDYTPMFAFLTLTIAISVAVYAAFQKQIVAGITEGAIKG